MNILWISNILFPEAQQILFGAGDLKDSGGWMLGAAYALIKNCQVNLSIATVSSKVTHLTKVKGEYITYYIIPLGKGNTSINLDYCSYWKQIYSDVRPDVVHIYGTEFSHGYAYLKSCDTSNVVISIQGLLSVCYNYYYTGISAKEIYQNITLRDLLKGNIFHDQRKFIRRSQYEIEMLKMVHHIIGRTSWDRSHTWSVNPIAKYYFCNETLRSEFYVGEKWSYETCSKCSIFLSQATYPIKGLHQLLKAMPLILRSHPGTHIRIAGEDITKSTTIKEKLRLSGYGKYIKFLIKDYNLEGKVTFIGTLNGEQMKQEYLKANVFVCPSTIENSPNSLGEAQILGTPCVASYVGGIMDMMKGNEDNLYRFDDVEMLAAKVCNVFDNKDKQTDMMEIAFLRHNPIRNSQDLYNIYKEIRMSIY